MQALPPPPIDPVEAGLAKAQARLSLEAGSSAEGLDAKALLAAVPQHLAFLRAAHRAGVSLRAPSAKTLERYASKWLPLLATADEGAALAPPPDVAWAWHCHRLAPRSYARTARRLGLPETEPFLIQAEGGSATEKAWAAAYPDEPFFLEGDSGDDAGALVLDGFDVAAACERQRTFLWQVSGPRFDEGYFLHDGARRYENFLRLMRSGEFLVPTYQIDLFWHTHILASASTYAADTRRLCGFELPHDDSVNDRAEGSKLNRQYEVTQKLWAEAYGGERYAVRGGMYRGEPPEAYFDATWEKETVEIRWRLLREAAGVTWQPGGAPPVAEGVVVGTSYVVPRVWSVEGDALASGLHKWIAYQPHDVATLEAALRVKGRVSLGLYDVDLSAMTQTRRETGVVRRVHVSSMPWWIYGANVRLDAAANAAVNEAYARGEGTATLPDGSVADLHRSR